MMKRFLLTLALALGVSAPAYAQDFPASPSTGDIYEFGDTVWKYDGSAWETAGALGPNTVERAFTSSGTWTPLAGMRHAKVEVIGGGGGGGGSTAYTNNTTCGAGGGSGGYSRSRLSAGEVGSSQTITIGAGGSGGAAGNNSGTNGGDTAVGSLVIAKGGSGGGYSANAANGQGGAGGIAGTGGLALPGNAGGTGYRGNVSFACPGFGGSAFYGGGALAIYGTSGQDATGYGGGGSGGGTFNSGALGGGDGKAGVVIITEYLGASYGEGGMVLDGHLFGLTLANNATDANNDIDIAVGEAADSNGNTLIAFETALTKQIDASFAAGDDAGCLDGSESVTGTPDTSTWYHFFLISNGSGGNADVLCSESATGPTMPSGYLLSRRLGAVYNDSGGNIDAFLQDGDRFLWDTAVTDYNSTASKAAALTVLSVPTGINVFPIMALFEEAGSGGVTLQYVGAPGVQTTADRPVVRSDNHIAVYSWTSDIRTNTSAQIWHRHQLFIGSSIGSSLQTLGWIDTRGRLN